MSVMDNEFITNENRTDDGYRFYSRGDSASRFDSYIDDYVEVPNTHPVLKILSKHTFVNAVSHTDALGWQCVHMATLL